MFSLGASMDAVFRGTTRRRKLPPTIILDYLYGVAAYNHWRSRKNGDELRRLMRNLHNNRESNDSEYVPSGSSSGDHNPGPNHPLASLQVRRSRRHTSAWKGNVMTKAMDDLNIVLMMLKGITPEDLIRRREQQVEEEEMRAQKASQNKVLAWIATI